MTKKQISILRLALLEINHQEIMNIEKLPTYDKPLSEDFNKKAYEIMNSIPNRQNHTISKRVAVILIASIISLLLVISVSAIKISNMFGKDNFLVNIYDSFISIFAEHTDDNTDNKMTKIYIPSYLPENYSMSKSIRLNYGSQTVYSNANEEIIFSQYYLSNTHINIDNENTEFESVDFGEKEIYYQSKYNTYNLYWYDDNCFFILSCPNNTSLNEIEAIINSIKIEK